MPGNLGTTTVTLRANANRFNQRINTASRNVTTFGNVARSAFGALGIGLVSGGVLQGVRSLTQFNSSLVETSSVLGTTVGELQDLRFVFESDGINADNADRSLQRFNRTLGEAMRGTTSAVDALAELGLTAQDFAGLSLTEQYILAANAIRELGDVTLQTAAAHCLLYTSPSPRDS